MHLLITDLVMPNMGGRELAQEIRRSYPHVCVLYISGYSDRSLAQEGVLEKGASFLHKPFRPGELLRKVRDLLDGPR